MVENLYRRFGALGGRVAGLQTSEEINTSRSNRRNVDASTQKTRVDTQRAVHDLRVATRFDAADRAAALQGQRTQNRYNAKIASILEKFGDREAEAGINLTESQTDNTRATAANTRAQTKEIAPNARANRGLITAQTGEANTRSATGRQILKEMEETANPRVAAQNAASERDEIQARNDTREANRLRRLAKQFDTELDDTQIAAMMAARENAIHSLRVAEMSSVSGVLQHMQKGPEEYQNGVAALREQMGDEKFASLNLPLEYIEGESEAALAGLNNQLIHDKEQRLDYEKSLLSLEEALIRAEASMTPRDRSVHKWWKTLEDMAANGTPEEKEWASAQMQSYIESQSKSRLSPEQYWTNVKNTEQRVYDTLYSKLAEGLNGAIDPPFTQEQLAMARYALDTGAEPQGDSKVAYETLLWMRGQATNVAAESVKDADGNYNQGVSDALAWANSPTGGGSILKSVTKPGKSWLGNPTESGVMGGRIPFTGDANTYVNPKVTESFFYGDYEPMDPEVESLMNKHLGGPNQ